LKNEDELKEHFAYGLLDLTDEKHLTFYNDLKQKLFPSKHVKQMTFNQKPSDENQKSTGAKKKTKYYNLYDKDGKLNDVVMLKGRVKCDCQATKHKLINNCLECGRIVCDQEGSGNCMFCGNLVCTEEELNLINSQTKKGDHLKKTLTTEKRQRGLEEAVAQRDRLLKYDRESQQRTVVLDDESDYFKSNSVWLSDSERKKLNELEEKLRGKKHAGRLEQKVTFDFAGRQIFEEPLLSKEIENQILQEIVNVTSQNNSYSNVHPDLANVAPVFDESILQTSFPKLKKSSSGFDGVYNRVQDKEFQEMSDLKSCLSMHQPWASLLVAGIKIHEGRTWHTFHKGRLWIASTAKPAEQEEIKALEDFYRMHYQNENIQFPTQYPNSVLLGCVEVTDCLPQEEYRKLYPDGESESPFVLICENPQELPVKFPIKGQHKICKLNLNLI
jgi:ribosomal protein S15P/S13E